MFSKKIFLLLLISISIIIPAFSQIEKPTTWSTKILQENPSVGDEVEIEFTAKIAKDWKIYSNDMSPEIGPIVTEFIFEKNPSFQLIGNIRQAKKPYKVFEEIWDNDVLIYKESAKFYQKVKILKENPTVKGKISFQSCTDVDGRCINANDSFSEKISTVATVETAKETIVPVPSEISDTTANIKKETAKADNQTVVPTTENSKPVEESQSLWQFLLIAFGAGLASIFMPCIYPIMPMTVSFFTKQENGRSKAIFYGISIMAIFAFFGLIVKIFGQGFPNFLSTHWAPNFFFFILFIIFGISLLGAFEIVLPHSLVNKVDKASDKGGVLGIFFMAFTLVLVSFSCTAPFVSTLLGYSVQGEIWRPVYGMLAYGLPFALVFSTLAIFPEFLKNLPKSGGWMGELKVVFGLSEFALALKFLSNIDLAYHFNYLHRNIFLVIWIVISILITLYILGLMRMPKDNKVQKYSWDRILFASLFFLFTLYLIPGVTGKPLSLLSGILPPMPAEMASETLANPNMKHLAKGLYGFKNYEEAQAYANEVNKPILIDFTGHACANCRKMEDNVWTKPGVFKLLKEDFVIASLYVDDKEELPKEKQYTSTYDDELKTTVGDKNMDFEITKYNNNAQPYYVIVNPNGEKILEPIGYSSVEDFTSFLEKGKAGYK
ncbi:DUF255 domain-containing protein [Lacihabitans sp. LS3-19]|uniref:protein-disulfide reductase DsbD family protein n=1 Tax=Lacihabitans sp. LS3-19 TaxID=2487335 RepID=UPI0020CD9DF1|nr:thioredoxin family protein [Lacihabitans sp. LS3-19]MCP9769126.1 DUF255 domain-containing protein [Lacihabitans sp. LS3-19]